MGKPPGADRTGGTNHAAPALYRRSLAEMVATFGLVFAGCGAIVANEVYGGAIGVLGVGLVFGLVITSMIYAVGHLSGAHINPAVTIAFVATRHFPARDAIAYIGAQISGAVAAAFLLLWLWPEQPAALGATTPSVDPVVALGYETVMSALLMFVIISVATDARAVGAAAAVAIGGVVALDAVFGGPVTGASMNPARTLGPALASNTWTDIWVYLLGPVAGTLIGGAVYQFLRVSGQESTGSR